MCTLLVAKKEHLFVELLNKIKTSCGMFIFTKLFRTNECKPTSSYCTCRNTDHLNSSVYVNSSSPPDCRRRRAGSWRRRAPPTRGPRAAGWPPWGTSWTPDQGLMWPWIDGRCIYILSMRIEHNLKRNYKRIIKICFVFEQSLIKLWIHIIHFPDEIFI